MYLFKQKFIFIFILSVGFVLSMAWPVLAQEDKDDIYCWTNEECLLHEGRWSKGGQYLGVECQKNFANKDLGLCYPRDNENIKLQVPIPLSEQNKNQASKYSQYLKVSGGQLTHAGNFPAYLAVIFTYFVGIIGIVAVAYLGYGGYEWMMAAGNSEKISKAKDTIQGAIVGVLLAVGSFVLLNIINSNLVDLNPLVLPKIKPIYLGGFCDVLPFEQEVVWKKDGQTVRKAGEARCGYDYRTSDNQSCIGLWCDPAEEKVCHYHPDENKYWCTNSKEACEDIDDDNVYLYGQASEDGDIYESVCNSYSKEGEGTCTWVEYATLDPTSEQCEWYTPEDINDICKDIKKCSDFDKDNIWSFQTELTGDDFAACHKNWCKDKIGHGCYIEWVFQKQAWFCRSNNINN